MDASLFTGQYPFEHGAHTEWIEPAQYGVLDNVNPLSPAAVTLAERFSSAGYSTAAFAANTVFLEARYGLRQGFETYEVKEGLAPEVNTRARSWLDARMGDQPFFLFLNDMDAHNPYNTTPREGWRGASDHPERVLGIQRQLFLAALFVLLLVGLVLMLSRTSTTDGSTSIATGRVWSAEHGHWHDTR